MRTLIKKPAPTVSGFWRNVFFFCCPAASPEGEKVTGVIVFRGGRKEGRKEGADAGLRKNLPPEGGGNLGVCMVRNWSNCKRDAK
jgi:hypothetical protein